MWFELGLSGLINNVAAERNNSGGDQVGCGFDWLDLERLQG